MTKFKKAIQSIPEIESAHRENLGALKTSDKNCIQNPDNIKINGSVYLDQALSAGRYSNSNRWDYGIGIVGGHKREEVLWVEIHPGGVSEIDLVLKKLLWLRLWLEESGSALKQFNLRYFWVTPGYAQFIPSSKEAKRLASQNLKNVGGALRLRPWE